MLKRNELSSHENTWKKLKCILLSEGSQSEKAAYCVILTTYVIFWKRQNYGDNKKISGCQMLVGGGGGEGEMNKQSTDNF